MGKSEENFESVPVFTMWVLGINLRSPGLAGGAGPAQQFLSLRTFVWSTVTKDHRVNFASAISFIAIGHLLRASHLCVSDLSWNCGVSSWATFLMTIRDGKF